VYRTVFKIWYAMWIRPLSNKISTRYVWLCSTYLYDCSAQLNCARCLIQYSCHGSHWFTILQPSTNTQCSVHYRHYFSHCPSSIHSVLPLTGSGTLQLKCDGTQWRTGGEVKGKPANGVGSQYPSHYLGTWCIQHYYRWCAHLGCQ